MSLNTIYGTEIVSVGMFVPPDIYTNDDLSKMMDTNHEWIVQRTGIEQRHWVKPEVATTDLALKACEEAILKAGIDKKEIECILFCTLSPDHDFPGNACFLQAKLGLTEIPAIDVRQQCSGFLYGLSIADHFIRLGTYKTILLVGAEIHSKGMDRTTKGRDVSVLFGDGAGAVILKRNELKNRATDSHVLSTNLFADGQFAKELWAEAPGLANGANRVDHQMIEDGKHFPTMNGKKVFVHATRRMCEALMLSLKTNNLSLNDIDLFLFHQANLRINQMIAQELSIPEEKIFNTIQKYGNTTAATIPIGMYEALKAGKLKKGSLVASAAFGSGFTWSSAVYRF